MEQISAANDLRQLRGIYEDIQVDLVELENEAYKKGGYKSAWGVGVAGWLFRKPVWATVIHQSTPLHSALTLRDKD